MKLVKPFEVSADELIAFDKAFRENHQDFTVQLFYGNDGKPVPISSSADAEAWVKQCALMEHTDTVPIEGYVDATHYYAIVDGEIVGTINLRHRLNDYLRNYGGHIGYAIVPDQRRKGYAREMLRLCLLEAATKGIPEVIITCAAANEPSRRTIESSGGKLLRTFKDNGVDFEQYTVSTDVSDRHGIEYRHTKHIPDEQLRELYNSDNWTAYTNQIDNLSNLLANCNIVYSAWDGDKLIGIIRTFGDNISICYIQDILVNSEYQGRGIGKRLLGHVLAQQADVRNIVLSTDAKNNDYVQRWYEKQGFRNYKDIGIAGYSRLAELSGSNP